MWLQKPAKKKPKKDATVSKPSSSRKKADDDGLKKKKPKKKKDPNAPKRAISAFMFFSQNEREVHILLQDFFLSKSVTSPRSLWSVPQPFVLRGIEKDSVSF